MKATKKTIEQWKDNGKRDAHKLLAQGGAAGARRFMDDNRPGKGATPTERRAYWGAFEDECRQAFALYASDTLAAYLQAGGDLGDPANEALIGVFIDREAHEEATLLIRDLARLPSSEHHDDIAALIGPHRDSFRALAHVQEDAPTWPAAAVALGAWSERLRLDLDALEDQGRVLVAREMGADADDTRLARAVNGLVRREVLAFCATYPAAADPACAALGVYAPAEDVREHRIVSQNLAFRLERKRELVRYPYSIPVWGRTSRHPVRRDPVLVELLAEDRLLTGQKFCPR